MNNVLFAKVGSPEFKFPEPYKSQADIAIPVVERGSERGSRETSWVARLATKVRTTTNQPVLFILKNLKEKN